MRAPRSGFPIPGSVLCLALLTAGPLAAQQDGPPEGHRKWVYGAAGALLVGVPAYASSDLGVGGCSSRNCFAPIAAAVGGIVGFLIGLEHDNDAARRWVAGPEVELTGTSFDLPLVADHVSPLPNGIALIGEQGLARAGPTSGVTSTHAARGVLALGLLPEHSSLLALTPRALLAFDSDASVRAARRAFGPGGSTMAVDGASGVVIGGEGTVRRLLASGTGTGVELAQEASVPDADPARTLVWSGDVIWELAGASVLARSAESLLPLGSASLAGPGREMVVRGRTAVVAVGDAGVEILDVSDPEELRVTSRYTGVRFAFDVELVEHELFVAAGEQGLVRLDISRAVDPVVTGVVGNLGQPYAVVESGGSLYVLDRDDRRLHVIDVTPEQELRRDVGAVRNPTDGSHAIEPESDPRTTPRA